jgi:hypothetical protein
MIFDTKCEGAGEPIFRCLESIQFLLVSRKVDLGSQNLSSSLELSDAECLDKTESAQIQLPQESRSFSTSMCVRKWCSRKRATQRSKGRPQLFEIIGAR